LLGGGKWGNFKTFWNRRGRVLSHCPSEAPEGKGEQGKPRTFFFNERVFLERLVRQKEKHEKNIKVASDKKLVKLQNAHLGRV